MFNIENISNNISTFISKELKLDQDNREIIAYGIFALLQIIISVILVIIFGLILNVTIEALIICFTVSILRKYSGGAHASTPNRCIIIGTFICIGQALLILVVLIPLVNPLILLILGMATFAWSYYIVYKLAPIDSPSKPIKALVKINRMKKASILVLSVYVIIAIINFTMYIYLKEDIFVIYVLCICGGVAWQSFTLTRLGHLTYKKIDALFK